MRRSARGRGLLRAAARCLPALLLCLPACSRLPRIIVLEDPLTPDEHVQLGVAYERKGELDLALREYGKALRADPGHFQARVNAGNVRLARKEFGKAREEYLEALSRRPDDPEATNNLAWAAILSGRDLPEALRRMEAVTARPEGRRPELLDTLGVVHLRLGMREQAREALREAERLCLAAPPGGSSCGGETLAQIREHLEEIRAGDGKGGDAPLVQ